MTSNHQTGQHDSGFLTGTGEMAQLIRTMDWSTTALGPVAGWPQSLRTNRQSVPSLQFPHQHHLGPGNVQIYNDGYRVVCGEAHPRALGQDYSVTWASAWPAVGEPFERARAGETSYLENQRMFLTRNGYHEETFFTFSTSPIRAEDGAIGGLFHPVTETTVTMLAERRTRALRDLASAIDEIDGAKALPQTVVDVLARFDYDLPFVLVYEVDDQGDYRLSSACGLPWQRRGSASCRAISLRNGCGTVPSRSARPLPCLALRRR